MIEVTLKHDRINLHIYEIVCAMIGLIKIPILAVAITLNGWVLVFFMIICGLFALVCDIYCGKIIAKLFRSITMTIIVSLIITAILIAITTLFLYFYTGGQEFHSCPGDYCKDTPFVEGVGTLASVVALLMGFIALIAVIIIIIKKIQGRRRK